MSRGRARPGSSQTRHLRGSGGPWRLSCQRRHEAGAPSSRGTSTVLIDPERWHRRTAVRLLLDEDVPKPLLPALRRVLTGHDVVHVDDLGGKRKKDVNLVLDAAGRGSTPSSRTTASNSTMPKSVELFVIRGCITFATGSRRAILAAMRQVVRDLEQADGQRLVLIHEIRNERRHEMTDQSSIRSRTGHRSQADAGEVRDGCRLVAGEDRLLLGDEGRGRGAVIVGSSHRGLQLGLFGECFRQRRVRGVGE